MSLVSRRKGARDRLATFEWTVRIAAYVGTSLLELYFFDTRWPIASGGTLTVTEGGEEEEEKPRECGLGSELGEGSGDPDSPGRFLEESWW